MKSRADVLESIRVKIRLLHLAYSTEEAYCGWGAQLKRSDPLGRTVQFARTCRILKDPEINAENAEDAE